jgi:hypothetical protein
LIDKQSTPMWLMSNLSLNILLENIAL